MGILDRLFGGGRRRTGGETASKGPEIVSLADRTPVETLSVDLVGVSGVNHDGGSRQAVIRRCSVGEEMVLMQEPRPRRYPPSIGVWSTSTGEQLGSLPTESSTYILLNARRYDFRSTIEELPEQDEGDMGVKVQIEAFEKSG